MPINPKNLNNDHNRKITCGKKKLPFVPTKDELLKFLAFTQDVSLGFISFTGCFQGLRIGEIVRLKWCDVDLKNGELKIVDGKNTRRYKSGYGKDRIVPINEMFLRIWQAWRAMNPEDDYVVPDKSWHGQRAPAKTLIRRYQQKLWDALKRSEMLEVDFYQKNGTPRYKFHMHSFRHVCGTNLRRAGMKIEDIRDFLGHEDIETTQVYTELTKDDLREISHIAYAYPKSNMGMQKMPRMEISVNKDTLVLQKEIVEKQLELAKIQMNTGFMKMEDEQYANL